jgi:hypothetical protein
MLLLLPPPPLLLMCGIKLWQKAASCHPQSELLHKQ